MEVVDLVGCYGLVPSGEFKRYGSAGSYLPAVQQLLSHQIIELCGPNQQKEFLRLSAKGEKFLQGHGYRYQRYAGQSLQPEKTRRYCETARVALLCRRAGIEVGQTDYDLLCRQPVFLQSKPMRSEKFNHVSSNIQCAGFGHWGGEAFLVYYASKESYGPLIQHENAIMHRLCPLYGKGFGMTYSYLLTGRTYAEAYHVLKATTVRRHPQAGQVSYAEAYQKTKRPFYLASCDDTGALQLALMRQGDYRARVSRLIAGRRWSPPPPELPVDAMDGDTPLVVALDMDLRRVRSLCETAWLRGFPNVKVAAMTDQVDGVLARALPIQGIELLYFDPGPLMDGLGGGLLYEPQHREAAAPEGGPLVV